MFQYKISFILQLSLLEDYPLLLDYAQIIRAELSNASEYLKRTIFSHERPFIAMTLSASIMQGPGDCSTALHSKKVPVTSKKVLVACGVQKAKNIGLYIFQNQLQVVKATKKCFATMLCQGY